MDLLTDSPLKLQAVDESSSLCSFSTGDLNLNVVAMALSGYTDEKSSLWREMCSSLRLQLKNPYLCIMFAFLTSEPGAYDGVLVINTPLSWTFKASL